MPYPMSLDCSCNIWTVKLELGLNKMKARFHPALYQEFRLLLVMQWCERYCKLIGFFAYKVSKGITCDPQLFC